ncbi:EF-hand domain-containing protein [Aurantiacibacter sp. MUD61]|uniref:EF-hand domain-containing protein n=1 Tax=Aurantiacibacter sp. MUD61 TaxID=3009083 RepID=UPI0022F0D922|nr:EF-hand domain-containing protein [Aurantiacibacter sp. MUD61]
MKKPLILAAALAGLTTTGMAAAQDMPRGDMTRADVAERAAAAFDRMDVTGDGVINVQDREARARERFAQADANGDGALTFEEMQAAREERREAREERRGQRAERGGRDQRGERAGRRGGRGMAMRMLRNADTDGDNAVSQAEFTAAALARFDRADANNDGTVTVEERRAQRAERRGQMRENRGRR